MEIVGCQIIDDSTKNIEGKIRERSKSEVIINDKDYTIAYLGLPSSDIDSFVGKEHEGERNGKFAIIFPRHVSSPTKESMSELGRPEIGYCIIFVVDDDFTLLISL